MGATMYRDAVQNALDYKNNTNHTFWIAIGRTSPWPDEDHPPSITRGETGVDEPICYRRASVVTLARSVSLAEYESAPENERALGDGLCLVFVSDEDAHDHIARYLYLNVCWNPGYDLHPANDFRQVGLYPHLVPAAGHESDEWLAPADVDDPGMLRYLDNDKVQQMDSQGPVVFTPVILEFK